jgi:hypothetical protein
MGDCRIVRQVAECNPQGKRRRDRPVNIWKDGIRNIMQRRNFKDKDCSERELWRGGNYIFVLRKTTFAEKFLYKKKHMLQQKEQGGCINVQEINRLIPAVTHQKFPIYFV